MEYALALRHPPVRVLDFDRMIRARRRLFLPLAALVGLTVLTGFWADSGLHPAAGLTGTFTRSAPGGAAPSEGAGSSAVAGEPGAGRPSGAAGPSGAVTVLRGVVPARQTLQRAIAAGRLAPPPFRAEWTGTLVATRAGRHLFEIAPGSGETSFVIDGQTLLTHARGSLHSVVVDLARGPHAIRVVHDQPAAPIALHVIWQEPGDRRRTFEERYDGQLFQGELSWSAYLLFRSRQLLPLVVIGLWMAAIVCALAALIAALLRRARQGAPLPIGWERLALPLILVFAFPLMVWGLTWGLPGYFAWAPDEVSPATLIDAVGVRFIGGWHHLYPPLQFYVLAPLGVVLRLAARAGWVDLDDVAGVTLLYVAMRGVSVAMALGMLTTVYGLARELVDVCAARVATLLALCSLTFLYYAKTANVDLPYLFWVMLSLRFYVRVLRDFRRADVLWLAATATAAVCTKDQAYGFYLLMPIALVVANVRHRRRRGEAAAWRDGVLDPVFGLAALVVVGLAAAIYLAPLNLDGVLGHLRVIRAGVYPAMVEAGPSGQLAFLRLNASLIAWTAGWPAVTLACAGVALAAWHARQMPLLLTLLVPVASYYLTFLAIVRYTYDRFLLGIWLVLAIFAGYAASRVLSSRLPSVRRAGAVALAGLFLYTVPYAITVNVMLGRDERYEAEQFLRARVSPFEVVGVLGQERYLPRLAGFEVLFLADDPGRVERFRPAFVLVHAEHPDWAPGTRELVARLEDGSLGYDREFASRPQPELPWWTLARDTWPIAAGRALGLTNLDKISPPIAIYTDRRRHVIE